MPVPVVVLAMVLVWSTIPTTAFLHRMRAACWAL